MAKQTINIGNIINDGAGDTLRAGATKINSNFNEIYSKLGNGTDINLVLDFTTPPTEGQVLQFNSLTGKFVPGEAGARGQIGPAGPQGPAGPIGPKGDQGDGNVSGPISSTDNAIVRYNGTSGREIQNSLVTVSDLGVIQAPVGPHIIPFYHASPAALPDPVANSGVIAVTLSDNKLYYSDGAGWRSVPREDQVVRTIQAGTGININQSTGNVVISADQFFSVSFNQLIETISTKADLTIDEIALPAITKITLFASSNTAWLADLYSGNNPTIYAISGTTIAFKIGGLISGGNLTIQTSGGSNYDTGLYHVDIDGTTSTGSAAQSKDTGTLYWRIPHNISGTYRYACLGEPLMVGNIVIKDIATI